MRVRQENFIVTESCGGGAECFEVFEAAELQRELDAEAGADRLVAVGIDGAFGVPEFIEAGGTQGAADGSEIAGIAEAVERENERDFGRCFFAGRSGDRGDGEDPLRVDGSGDLREAGFAERIEIAGDGTVLREAAFRGDREAHQLRAAREKFTDGPHAFADTVPGFAPSVSRVQRPEQRFEFPGEFHCVTA